MKNLVSITKEFIRKLSRTNLSAHAASTAFFFFLSLIPMIMLICSALSFTPLLRESDLLEAALLLPNSVTPLFVSLIDTIYDSSFGVFSVSAIVTIWSAGKGVLALMRGLNAMNGVLEKRNYFVQRMIASCYLIVFLIMILFLLVVMVFGNLLTETVIRYVPETRHLFELLMCFRELFSGVFLTVIFMLLYSVLPCGKSYFRSQLPGALFSSTSWLVFSWVFSLYIMYSGSFNMYGSLTAIIIVMLWLYFGCYIFLTGAYLNRYLRLIKKHD